MVGYRLVNTVSLMLVIVFNISAVDSITDVSGQAGSPVINVTADNPPSLCARESLTNVSFTVKVDMTNVDTTLWQNRVAVKLETNSMEISELTAGYIDTCPSTASEIFKCVSKTNDIYELKYKQISQGPYSHRDINFYMVSSDYRNIVQSPYAKYPYVKEALHPVLNLNGVELDINISASTQEIELVENITNVPINFTMLNLKATNFTFTLMKFNNVNGNITVLDSRSKTDRTWMIMNVSENQCVDASYIIHDNQLTKDCADRDWRFCFFAIPRPICGNLKFTNDKTKLTWTCTASKVYPETSCKMEYKKDHDGYKTVSARRIATSTGKLSGYRNACTLTLPLSDSAFTAGSTYKYRVTMYPPGKLQLGETTESNEITLRLPHVKLSNCPTGDFMKYGYIKTDTTVKCQCDLTEPGSPNGKAVWLNSNSGSLLTLNYDASNPNPTYTCQAQSTFRNGNSVTYTPIYARTPELLNKADDGQNHTVSNSTNYFTIYRPIVGIPSPTTITLYKYVSGNTNTNNIMTIDGHQVEEVDKDAYRASYLPEGIGKGTAIVTVKVIGGQYVMTVGNGIGNWLKITFNLIIGDEKIGCSSNGVVIGVPASLYLVAVIISLLVRI